MSVLNKTMNGAIIIFHRKHNGRQEFLIVQNAKTGNISFVGGGRETGETLEETARREVKEELGLNPTDYVLVPTDVAHEFIFGSKKSERTGQRGSYAVFLAKADSSGTISHTGDLTRVAWKSKEDVLKELSFEDLKDVFVEAIAYIVGDASLTIHSKQ